MKKGIRCSTAKTKALLFDATLDGVDFADSIFALNLPKKTSPRSFPDPVPECHQLHLKLCEITLAVAAWFEWIVAFAEEDAKSVLQHFVGKLDFFFLGFADERETLARWQLHFNDAFPPSCCKLLFLHRAVEKAVENQTDEVGRADLLPSRMLDIGVEAENLLAVLNIVNQAVKSHERRHFLRE